MAKKVISRKTTPTTKEVTTKATTTKKLTQVRVNKLARSIQSKELVDIDCRECGAPSMKSRDVTSFVCWQCVHEACGDQELPKVKRVTGFPRGWAFMNEFIHTDGTVYFKGVEQPKLKGTKKPTIIKASAPKSKKSKAQRAQEKMEVLVELIKESN